MLCPSRGLPRLAPTASLRSECKDSHFTDEETEAQRGQGTGQGHRARKRQRCTVNQGCGLSPHHVTRAGERTPSLVRLRQNHAGLIVGFEREQGSRGSDRATGLDAKGGSCRESPALKKPVG